MASAPLSPALRYIRKIVDGPGSALVTDSQLLDRFVHHRNEAAFAALVKKVLSQPSFIAVEDEPRTFRLGGEQARLDHDHKGVEFIPVGPSVTVKVTWSDHGRALLETCVEHSDPIKTTDQELQVLTKKLVAIKEVKLGEVEKITLQKSDKKKDQLYVELTVKLADVE